MAGEELGKIINAKPVGVATCNVPRMAVGGILGPHVGGCQQCSRLKCAHAFQCEGLQKNHTSLKLSKVFWNTSPKKQLDIGHLVLKMKII